MVSKSPCLYSVQCMQSEALHNWDSLFRTMEAFPSFVGRDIIWDPNPDWREFPERPRLRRPKIGRISVKSETQLLASPAVIEIQPRVQATSPFAVATESQLKERKDRRRTDDRPVGSIAGYRIGKKQPEAKGRSISPITYYKIGKSPLEIDDQPLVPITTYKFDNVNLHIPAHVPQQMRKYQCPVDDGRYLLRWDATGRLVSLIFEANKKEKLSTPIKVKEELRKRKRLCRRSPLNRPSANSTSPTSTAAGTSSGHYEADNRSDRREYTTAMTLMEILREFFPSNQAPYGNQSKKRKR